LAKKRKSVVVRLSAKALFKQRSAAAKKGWVTRRGLRSRFSRKQSAKEALAEAAKTIRMLKARARKAEIERDIALEHQAVAITEPSQVLRLENLGMKPRLIFETRLQYAARIVETLARQGVSRDRAYKRVAEHVGIQPAEVYTLFHYVGVGEFVA
jgi:hypothetical protein